MTDEDWVERPVKRLERLERALQQGVEDQAELHSEVTALRKAVEAIQHTLNTMASDEISDLKRRADLPRRIVQAVFIPVLIATIAAVMGSLVAAGHLF